AFGVLVGIAGLGALVDMLVPGPIGVVAHQVASPFLALEDLQAALFAVPHAAVGGVGAAIAALAVVALALYAATTSFEVHAERRPLAPCRPPSRRSRPRPRRRCAA